MSAGLTLPPEILELYSGMVSRAATIDALDEDERTITMRAVPYEVEAQIAPGVVEVFTRGAFRAVKDPGRCKLWHGHSTTGGQVVGSAFNVEDREDGLWLQTRVSRTAAGDELLTLARDGVLDEASIEFAPIREAMRWTRRGDDTLVRHHRAYLKGVGLVPHGAYGRSALVTSVRDDTLDTRRAEWVARLRTRTA